MKTITAAQPNEQAVARPPSRHWPFAPAAVVIAYIVLGISAYWSAYGEFSQNPVLQMYDFRQSVWFLAWMGHALTHGLNPFFSNSIFVPSGVNLAQNTSSPLLGL